MLLSFIEEVFHVKHLIVDFRSLSQHFVIVENRFVIIGFEPKITLKFSYKYFYRVFDRFNCWKLGIESTKMFHVEHFCK